MGSDFEVKDKEENVRYEALKEDSKSESHVLKFEGTKILLGKVMSKYTSSWRTGVE